MVDHQESARMLETTELTRFFASLVGTEGVSDEVKEKSNVYLLQLINSMKKPIDKLTSSNSGLHSI